MNTRLLTIRRNVWHSQARGCWGYVQVGTVAVFIFWRIHESQGWRLELFTPSHRFRWSA